MDDVLRNHPVPTAALPAGIDPDSADSLRTFVRGHRFPSVVDGRFLFAFVDEEERFARVQLRHGLAGHRAPPALHPCAGGLHILELDASAVDRIEYRFNLVDRSGRESLVIDPLNPHTARDPFATRSVIARTSYSPPAYAAAAPAEARGTIDELEIAGPLGKPWSTWVWSPPHAAPRQPLPVVVFLDGGDWLQLAAARNMLENLIAQHRMQPCRAVFLKPAARNEDYAANPTTAAFLGDGLRRAISHHVPWPDEPMHRIAVGVSLGALCLLHAHFTQPASNCAFGGLILQSGSFFQPRSDPMETGFAYFDQIAGFVARTLGGVDRAVPRIPVHMTCGAGEENVINNRIMAEALIRQHFPLELAEQPDAHNWTCWRDSVGAGLMRLLKP